VEKGGPSWSRCWNDTTVFAIYADLMMMMTESNNLNICCSTLVALTILSLSHNKKQKYHIILQRVNARCHTHMDFAVDVDDVPSGLKLSDVAVAQ